MASTLLLLTNHGEEAPVTTLGDLVAAHRAAGDRTTVLEFLAHRAIADCLDPTDCRDGDDIDVLCAAVLEQAELRDELAAALHAETARRQRPTRRRRWL